MIEKVVLLDIEKILPPNGVQREMIDPEKIRELAESIRAVGQLEAGQARPVDGGFEIVFGHRRYLALRLLGETKMKMIVRELSDEQVFEMRAIENLQRVDLNPIEKARVFQRWKEKFNLSAERIAARVGMTKVSIYRYLQLLEVPEEFHAAIARKDLGIETVLILMEVEDESMRAYYLRAAVDNGITGPVARMWVDDYKKTRAGQFYAGGEGEGGSAALPERVLTYATCFCCNGPEEVQAIQYVPVCKECHKQIRGAVKLIPQA